MKKVLKFSGLAALVLALVAFILLMATHSVVNTENSGTWFSGISAVFGGGTAALAGFESDSDSKLAWVALLAWIFILVAMLIIIAGIVLPLLKIHALDKVAGILNLVSVCLLVVAGVLVFFTVPAFASSNEWSSTDYWSLGGGFITAGILSILAGAVAICPEIGRASV